MRTKIITMLAAAIILTACNDKKSDAENTTSTDTVSDGGTPAEQATTADLYACPMHPEVTGNKDDICPKCEMKLTSPVVPGGRVDDPR